MKHAAMQGLILIPAVVFLSGCRSPSSKVKVVMPPTSPSAIVAPTSAVPVATPMVPMAATPQPTVNPKSLRQERRDMEAKIDRLEQFTAEQKKLQARLNNELYDLQRRLAAVQTQVQQVEERAAETARKIADGETKLADLKHDLARWSNHAPTAVPDAKLADQKRQMETQRTKLQQREAEIRDLRTALAARDATMKEEMRGSVVKPPPAVPLTFAAPVAVPQLIASNSSLSASQMVAEGNRLLRDGNPDEADVMFSMALAQDPFLVGARLGLASCRYARGDLSEAKKLADKVIKAEPRNAEALGLAGIIAWRQNDLKLATTLLERAIKQNPKDAPLHNYLGILCYAQGKRSRATAELEKAVELNPNLPEAHFNLAVLLATDHHPQFDQARGHYQSSLRLGNARDEKLEGILYP
jgi:tetratricopeptide (TPR) repeat protein